VRDGKLLEHDIVCVLSRLFNATAESPFHQVANAQLNNPNGLAFDSEGNLWGANYAANQVLELNPSNGTVLKTITDYVKGPTRLAFDSLVNLWVANTTAGTVIDKRRSGARPKATEGKAGQRQSGEGKRAILRGRNRCLGLGRVGTGCPAEAMA
jgi:DNA-binding beta-propeller fold protein YncE